MAVYFIKAGKLVKIGYAGNYHQRLQALQITSPVSFTVLAVLHGGLAVERAYHERFAALRRRGEWFVYGAALKEFIETEVPTLRLDARTEPEKLNVQVTVKKRRPNNRAMTVANVAAVIAASNARASRRARTRPLMEDPTR